MRSKTLLYFARNNGQKKRNNEQKLFFTYIRLTFNLKVVIQTVFILALQTKKFFFHLLGKNTKSFSMSIKYHWEKNHNEKIKLFKFLKLAYAFKIFGKYIWSISNLVLFGGC